MSCQVNCAKLEPIPIRFNSKFKDLLTKHCSPLKSDLPTIFFTNRYIGTKRFRYNGPLQVSDINIENIYIKHVGPYYVYTAVKLKKLGV